jgi:hypothetical protein
MEVSKEARIDAREIRLGKLRGRVRFLRRVGWYDERDVSMIGEWIKTGISLFEVEAIVGWAERDYEESKQARGSA